MPTMPPNYRRRRSFHRRPRITTIIRRCTPRNRRHCERGNSPSVSFLFSSKLRVSFRFALVSPVVPVSRCLPVDIQQTFHHHHHHPFLRSRLIHFPSSRSLENLFRFLLLLHSYPFESVFVRHRSIRNITTIKEISIFYSVLDLSMGAAAAQTTERERAEFHRRRCLLRALRVCFVFIPMGNVQSHDSARHSFC